MTRVNIEISDEVHKKAKMASLVQDITLQEFINKAMEEKVKRDEKLEKLIRKQA